MSKVSTRKINNNIAADQKFTRGNIKEKENPTHQNNNPAASFLKHFKKVYPLGIYRSNSLLSISSFSSSISQNSTDSSLTDSSTNCSLDQKIVLSLESLRKVRTNRHRRSADQNSQIIAIQQQEISPQAIASDHHHHHNNHEDAGETLKRCQWITKNSDKLYVTFHDEQWGVPVYDDNRLFELLSMSGMLMDYNWTEILKRKELLREVFAGFDPNTIATIDEEEIMEISTNKELGLAESRARCIIDNARAILKVVEEHGSFSGFIWGYFNYKPVINRYKHSRSVPLRSPKSETISKDLIRLGFRLVGPVIIQSFMQCAGMSIDHLVDCFRYKDCVTLAENPWKHI